MSSKTKTLCSTLGIGLTLILCLILGLSILTSTKTQIASATTTESNLEELCKLYTDSDNVYGSQKTIHEYPTNLIASNATITGKNDNTKLNISGDDPIVNIIPKQYFKSNGEQFYIGKEYGFL